MSQKHDESFIEKIEDEVIAGTKNLVNGNIKKRFYRFGEFSLFLAVGIILGAIGASLILGKFVPILDNGFNFIIIATIFFIISLVLK